MTLYMLTRPPGKIVQVWRLCPLHMRKGGGGGHQIRLRPYRDLLWQGEISNKLKRTTVAGLLASHLVGLLKM